MIRILFLEGPRASGKTTVADAFVKLGWERIKVERTSKPGEAYQDQVKMLEEYLAHPEKKYVVDRFHLTELIMTKYTKRDNPIEAEINARLIHNDILHIHDAAVIMLLPPKEILEERMTNISKPLDMPICEAYYEWKIAANKFNVPIFYFLDTEGVNLFASLVDGDHKGG